MKPLNYLTITNTIAELVKVGKIDISIKLLDILSNNELSKPEKHNRKNDLTTSFYRIKLDEDSLEEIRDLLVFLEASSLSENGEATVTTNHYGNLLDEWCENY